MFCQNVVIFLVKNKNHMLNLYCFETALYYFCTTVKAENIDNY